MCFDNGAKAAAQQAQQQAAEIQAREDKRQADIKQGQSNIDTAFGQFDDNYYNTYKDAYTHNYTPQIEDQYHTAQDKLTAQLAGRGMLESTVGADAVSKLGKTKLDSENQIAGSAQDAANGLRSNVENAKTALYTQNQAAADPSSAAAQAAAQAGAIVAPQAYPQLGNIFGAALQPFALASKVDGQSMNPQLPWNQGSKLASGSGSAIFG